MFARGLSSRSVQQVHATDPVVARAAPTATAVAADCAPLPPRKALIRIPPRALTEAQAIRFIDRVIIPGEREFYRPGVAWDAATGMTFDGHAIDVDTGALFGEPRKISAASKESLHLGMLAKSLLGDPTCGALFPRAQVLDVLARKIETYERFFAEHPGYGGFLPWYAVAGGKIEPAHDWRDRVPGLDNGQLAWSLYLVTHVLEQLGERALADRYRARLDEMKKNVVRIFYDPAERQLRAEAKLGRGSRVVPEENEYTNNVRGYLLDDSYEGTLLVHFAELFGDWHDRDAREGLWRKPRAEPAEWKSPRGALTVARGCWFSSHEDWAFLVLPFRDIPLVRDLFDNANKARTIYAAANGDPGLAASAHAPRTDNGETEYTNARGVPVPAICKRPLDAGRVFAPYASSPLALSDRGLFATWLKTMTEAPRMRGPLGFAESFDADREAIAPILTWDGKALPMIAWSGGLVDEIRKYLIADDLYDRFIARARSDYRAFDPDRLEGRHIAIAAPTVRFCAANTGAIGRSATGARARRRPASYHEAS